MKKLLSKKDNRGIALISVMVVMTVVMLMATLIVELAYTSLLSRRVNTKSTKNFYAAQSALDDMSTVLQSIAVYSAKELENSTGTDGFIEVAEKTLQDAAGISGTFSGQMSDADSIKMSQFFFENLSPEVKAVLGTYDETKGKYVYDGNKLRVTAAMKNSSNGTKSKGAITLTIELNYLDENGYMTNISTDLVMNNVVNRPPASAYSLASYSMFTGGGAAFSDNNKGKYSAKSDTASLKYGAFIQEGNVYIGTMANSKNALDVYHEALICDGNRVIINGDVQLTNGGVLSFPGGQSSTGAQTIVDVRGTIYIDSTSALVLGNGIDLLVNDIKISTSRAENDNWINNAQSVFTTTTQYAKAGTKVFNGKSNWPLATSLATMKTSPASTNYALDEFYNSETTSGCVVYTDGTNSYVIECKQNAGSTGAYSWYKLGTNDKITGITLNRDTTLGPIAKATFWGYDGSTHTVDGELSNFVNLGVLYYQAAIGDGGGLDMNNPTYLGTGNPGVTRNQTIKFAVKDENYKLPGVSTVNGMTSKQYRDQYDTNKKSAGEGILSLSNGFSFNGVDRNSVAFTLGCVSSVLHGKDPKRILWSNQWKDVIVQVVNGTYLATVISADRAEYENHSQGVSVCYSLVNGNHDSLVKLVNELKYINIMKKDELNGAYTGENGNGSKYQSSESDKVYGVGMLDSLYKGGMDAFLDEVGDSGPSGPVTFDVTSMYDFITIENWRTN